MTASQTVHANPMVHYLHSLRTQSEGHNPSYVDENRRPFLKRLREAYSWFPTEDALHVRTRLDELAEALTTGHPVADVVVLTGDAGDGKTALCAMVARRLGHVAELEAVQSIGAWTVLKDASELTEQHLSESMQRAFRHASESPYRLLVAINEGRLRRLGRLLRKSDDAHVRSAAEEVWSEIIDPSLRSDLTEEDAGRLGEAMQRRRFVVLNFRHRMHVRTVAPGLLSSWTEPALWEQRPTACGGCPSQTSCPVLQNVRDLRDADAQQRLADVLTAAHYAGQRLPFRRLQGVLASVVTGGLDCADVQGLLAEQSPLIHLEHRAYDMLYPSIHRVGAPRPEPVTSALVPTDPAGEPDELLSEEIDALIFGSAPVGETTFRGHKLGPIEGAALDSVRRKLAPGVDGDGDPTDDGFSASEAMELLVSALRRQAGLLPSPPRSRWRVALELLDGFAVRDDGATLLRTVVRALNALQRMRATNETELTGQQVDPSGFRNPDRLAIELDLGTDFDVALERGPALAPFVSPWIESSASEINLVAWPRAGSRTGCERLRIDLALLVALLTVDDGYALVHGLGPYRRDRKSVV